MSDDHIIEVRSEEERRQFERRAADRDLASRVTDLERAGSKYRLYVAGTEQFQRERRYAVLQTAAILVSSGRSRFLDWRLALEAAEEMLTELERKDAGGA